MNLDGLPTIQFVDYDAASVESEIIANYEAAAERTLAPGDPVRLFLESLAYEITRVRFQIDWAAKQNLLAYAAGNFLDQLGALFGVERLEAAAATVSLRFSLSTALGFDVIIPAGTRATPDGELMFATSELAAVTAGETYVDVIAECESAGTVGNGYLVGQINQLVDPVAYIETVENIVASAHGAEAEADDHLRTRINLAPETFSTAGPRLAYRALALSADSNLVDAAVYSDTPGVIRIVPLLTDGLIPDQTVLDAVAAAVSAEDRRPLSDQPVVSAPEQIDYSIDLTYYVGSDYAALLDKVQATVAEAVESFTTWQCSALGRDLNPSRLIQAVQEVGGVKRVELVSPAYTALAADQVAVLAGSSVVFGGLEDE